MSELKLTVKLDLPCGCSEEHPFGEGEIVYFIENEDKQLDKQLFGFWLNSKIRKHMCIATTEDVERYLLTAIKFAYPYGWFERQPNYNNNYLRELVELFARTDGKKIV